MSSQGSITPEAAAAVYELADTLTQLWYYAERRWWDAEPGEPPPDRVDVLVGRALQLTEDLARQAAVAAPAEALVRTVSAAWDQYRAAWQGREHVETLEQLQGVDSDFRFEAERLALGRSPLAGPAWTDLKRAAAALQEALPPALRTCFEVSSLLAGELYPTDERNQRVEQLDVTERRFLTVTLNRELGQLLGTLAQEFPQFGGLDCDLSGRTETRALDKIGRLHRAIPRRLKGRPARKRGEGAPPAGAVDVGAATPADSGGVILTGERRGAEAVEPGEIGRLLRLKKKIDPEGRYIGESPAILRVFERIARYNEEPDKPVLILGPTGAGKTEIAELIHRSSPRGARPFHREQAADNMASDMTIAKGRWAGYGKESGLQGIPREGQAGLLEQHSGGTIFVDELAELPLPVQTLLLDVLDKKTIPAAAGVRPIKPDVRLVFATNVDIDEAARERKLRHDLVRRVRQYTVTIPPLKERREDVLLFARRLCGNRRPTPGFLLCLLRHDWPGNVGELKDVLGKACARTRANELLSVDHLELGDPAAAEEVRRLAPEAVEKAVYEALAGLFRRQGFTKRKGLFKRMAQFLGTSEPTVSRKASAYLSPQE